MRGVPDPLIQLEELKEDVAAALVASFQRHLGKAPGQRRRRGRHLYISATQIRALRHILGLSQRFFASQLGLSGTVSLQSWEHGRRRPNRVFTQRIRKLATFNGLDIEKLEDKDYFDSQLHMRISMEPIKVTLEKLERVAAQEPGQEPGKENTDATV